MKNKFWLTLEPTVDVRIRENDCFLYDTISNNKVEVTDSFAAVRLLKELSKTNNVIPYELNEQAPKEMEFINLLRNNFMGDLIPANDSGEMPFQMTNIINIQRDEAKLRIDNPNSISLGEKIIGYLKELNIVLNNTKNEAYLPGAYRQFQYCCSDEVLENEVDFDDLVMFMSTLDLNELRNINIQGSSIGAYTQIDKLLDYLDGFSLVKNLFFHADVFSRDKDRLKTVLSFIKNKYWFRPILFVEAKKIDTNKVKECLAIFNDLKLKFRVNFILENEEDYAKIEQLINDLSIKSYSISPYYNGKNIAFFQDNVFLSKEDILEQELDLKRINTLKKMNPNFFGKLYINSMGEVFSNVNLSCSGHIKEQTVSDVLYTEFHKKGSWFATKEEDSTCGNCLYCSICPPKSNYEFFLNKSDLCSVNMKE